MNEYIDMYIYLYFFVYLYIFIYFLYEISLESKYFFS